MSYTERGIMEENHNQHTLKKGITIWGFLLITLVNGCMSVDSMCATQLYDTIPSPNGELKAVLYQRDCGATTPFTTNISIMEANDSLKNEPGNIYRRRGDPKNFAPLLQWQSDDELLIIEESPDEFYENAQSWESSRSKVTISYSEPSRPIPSGSTPTRPMSIPTSSLPVIPTHPLLPTPSSTLSGQ